MRPESGPPRIDIHAHYFPAAFIDALETDGCTCGACVRRDPRGPVIDVGPLHAGPLSPRFIDLDLRIEAMDAQGVHIQALSLTQPMVYFADEPVARCLSAVFNDALVAAHERHPDRLVGLAMIPAHHAGAAIAELERVASAPGICGVYMGTAIGEWNLSDERLFPVFERIEALGLPVFLHPLKVVGMEDRLADYFLANLLGNPFDTAIAATHLILGGVLDRFPRLDIVLPHAGGALASVIGRLDHGAKVRPELSHMTMPPSAYLKRFFYDTITHSDAALEHLVRLVGPERILLGSDYCFDMGVERPVAFVESQTGLGTAEQAAILGGNAAALLGLAERAEAA